MSKCLVFFRAAPSRRYIFYIFKSGSMGFAPSCSALSHRWQSRSRCFRFLLIEAFACLKQLTEVIEFHLTKRKINKFGNWKVQWISTENECHKQRVTLHFLTPKKLGKEDQVAHHRLKNRSWKKMGVLSPQFRKV